MRSTLKLGLFLFLALAGGCATNRTITISARPADARLQIDGVDRGRGPLTQTFSFGNDTDSHSVTATRLGYQDQTVKVTRDFDQPDMLISMKHESRKINITVLPVPAMISADGVPITTEPVSSVTKDMSFDVDARNDWISKTVTAERFGYQPRSIQVSWTDRSPDYVINLDHLRKDLSITSNPSGADIYLDSQYLGRTTASGPLIDPGREFFTDPDTNTWKPRKLMATKAGYDSVSKDISWDGGKSDYTIDLTPKTKSIRILTDPPGAIVTLDGKELPRDASGVSFVNGLSFPPNDRGVLKTYTGLATKKTADSEWYPLPFTIAWDDGKTDYPMAMKEILTRQVPLLEAKWEHGDEGWTVVPQERKTIGMKDTGEGPQSRRPVLLTHVDKGTTIDTLDVSPDGTELLFTVLSGKDRVDFHSRMLMVRTDGTGGVDSLSDGRSLDLTPSFSPAGDQIAFASDRFGRRLSICTIAANGAPGLRQLTTGENNALWPSIDSEPQQRLFYQAFVDTYPYPRIWENQIGMTIRSDLVQTGGTQPRISPRDDSLLFTGVNEKTGKREIFRVSDKGGVPENLTSSPDADDYDPAWSHDGDRIAFVSEQDGNGNNPGNNPGNSPNGTAAASGGAAGAVADGSNADIWILDMKGNNKPVQITSNPSVDDHPVWDPSGNAIYFRSNRGGSWGIWKIAIK